MNEKDQSNLKSLTKAYSQAYRTAHDNSAKLNELQKAQDKQAYKFVYNKESNQISALSQSTPITPNNYSRNAFDIPEFSNAYYGSNTQKAEANQSNDNLVLVSNSLLLEQRETIDILKKNQNLLKKNMEILQLQQQESFIIKSQYRDSNTTSNNITSHSSSFSPSQLANVLQQQECQISLNAHDTENLINAIIQKIDFQNVCRDMINASEVKQSLEIQKLIDENEYYKQKIMKLEKDNEKLVKESYRVRKELNKLNTSRGTVERALNEASVIPAHITVTETVKSICIGKDDMVETNTDNKHNNTSFVLTNEYNSNSKNNNNHKKNISTNNNNVSLSIIKKDKSDIEKLYEIIKQRFEDEWQAKNPSFRSKNQTVQLNHLRQNVHNLEMKMTHLETLLMFDNSLNIDNRDSSNNNNNNNNNQNKNEETESYDPNIWQQQHRRMNNINSSSSSNNSNCNPLSPLRNSSPIRNNHSNSNSNSNNENNNSYYNNSSPNHHLLPNNNPNILIQVQKLENRLKQLENKNHSESFEIHAELDEIKETITRHQNNQTKLKFKLNEFSTSFLSLNTIIQTLAESVDNILNESAIQREKDLELIRNQMNPILSSIEHRLQMNELLLTEMTENISKKKVEKTENGTDNLTAYENVLIEINKRHIHMTNDFMQHIGKLEYKLMSELNNLKTNIESSNNNYSNSNSNGRHNSNDNSTSNSNINSNNKEITDNIQNFADNIESYITIQNQIDSISQQYQSLEEKQNHLKKEINTLTSTTNTLSTTVNEHIETNQDFQTQTQVKINEIDDVILELLDEIKNLDNAQCEQMNSMKLVLNSMENLVKLQTDFERLEKEFEILDNTTLKNDNHNSSSNKGLRK